MTYPMTNNNWMQYFEDVGPNPNPHANRNQYNAGQTTRYFLERPDLNPGWQTHSTNLINWIETTFGGTDQGEPGLQYGARVNSEQDAYKFKMASHPSRFAAICALLAEKTGDLALKEKAFRSLNWCTSMARSTGSVIEGPFEFAANQNNYEFVWRNVPVGTFPISARATNTNSQTATTSSTVTIASPTAPTQVGNTNEGTTTDYITDGSGAYINACRFVASADQQRTIIKAKVNAITGKYQCAIYSDSGGNASALLRASNEVTPAANGTAYWLAIWSNDTTARVHADNGGTLKFAAYPYGTWPNPVNLTGSGSFTYCMYATGPGKTACQQWKQNNVLPDAASPTGDDDQDSLPLLAEYAFGGDPAAFSTGPAFFPAIDNGHLTLTYPKVKAATDITVLAEVTSDLVNWSSNATDADQQWQLLDGNTQQLITARDLMPNPSATRRFMRVRVANP